MYSNIILSIIIPVYNVEKYLDQCIRSVIHYKGKDRVEIILINDGATDNSIAICQKYTETYNNISFVSQENQGLSEARNTGIRYAKGEYLLFLDSDDFIVEDILYKIIDDIRGKDIDIFLGRALKYYGEDGKIRLSQIDYKFPNGISPDNAFEQLNNIRDFWFAAWLIIINREFLLRNNLFFKKGILHEDELWVPSVFIKASSIGFLNYGFYCYRLNREGSIVSGVNIRRDFDKIIVADELSALYGKNRVSDRILNDRRAAIEYGLIYSLCKHKCNEQYGSLKDGVRKRLSMLNFGKYRPIYWLCKIFGVSFMSRILSIRYLW